jgi:predicted Zn-dependent protease
MRLRGFIGMVALYALLVIPAGAVAPSVPLPAIQPGYKPTPQGKDEQGLWLEMQEYEQQLMRSPLLVRDPGLNTYVKDITCRVAGPYCADIRVYIVRNPAFNASMAPNGTMIIWTGLLTRVSSGDELATVLGHETAHFVRTHSITQWRSIRKGMAAGQILSLGLGVATGVLLPVGESFAALSALSFSRQQEAEADLLGAQMMAGAGFDPHASYRVWDMLIAEDKRAVDKGEEGSTLLRTHPESDDRSEVLREWTTATYGPPPAPRQDPAFRDAMAANYRLFMDDQIDTSRYSRTEFLLERHAAIGVDPALIEFYRGEMFRQRAGDGDAIRARDAYAASVAMGHPVPDAYRNLGYFYTKAGDRQAARENFKRYLEVVPDADDRAMIEFYLQDEDVP